MAVGPIHHRGDAKAMRWAYAEWEKGRVQHCLCLRAGRALDNMFSICSYEGARTNNEHNGESPMNATNFLKEATALLGLFFTLYLWSVLAFALQT